MPSSPSTESSAPVRRPLLNKGQWALGNSFVIPDLKMVYISTTKVACSSLRWMMADLAGEDFKQFYRASGDHQTRLMTIHAMRAIWKHTPQLLSLPKEQLAQISPDDGWFVFTAVRDPWSRLFSAWQSKFLVRHASYVIKYGEQPWFPRVPKKPEDILADWYAFVEARPWESNELLLKDPHFQPQVDSVRPKGVNYSRIYDLREMPELISHVHEHLRGLGRDKELYLPSVNESPVLMRPDVLDNGVAEVIEDSFRADFEAFGHFWSRDRVKTSDVPWSMDAVRAVGYHGLANQRIGDMSADLKAAREDMRRYAQRARAAEAKLTSHKVATTVLRGRALPVALRVRDRALEIKRGIDRRRAG